MCTGMAGCNFNGLQQVYGEHILNKIIRCEFHFQESIKRRIRQIGGKGVRFQTLANTLLTASTPEAYNAAKLSLEQFTEEEVPIIVDWLTWRNDRKSYFFRAFKGYEDPRSNLVEVIHAVSDCFMKFTTKNVLFGIN